MATVDFIGPENGDWFDPENWSGGVVPAAGDTVDIRQSGYPSGAVGPDATGGVVAGVTIDLSEGSLGRTLVPTGGVYALLDPAFDLVAGQLGTASAPVALNSTSDTTDANNFPMTIIDDSIVSFGTLVGSLGIGDVCDLTIASAAAGPGVTIDGNVTMGLESELTFTSYVSAVGGDIPAAPVTLDGDLAIGGGGSNVTIYSDDLTGSGTIGIPDLGVLEVAQDPLATSVVEDVAVAFVGTGGLLDASRLAAGYGGTISNFATGDQIDGASGPGDPLVTGYADQVLTVTDVATGANQRFTFAGNYDASSFRILSDGPTYAITYGPTDTYVGPAGGDWFAASNWSAGAVPPMTAMARLYGTAGAVATGGTIVSTALDVSGSFTDAGTGPDRALIGPAFDLVAGQIGTDANPTTIDVTGNSGVVADAAITFTTLNGGIDVTDGQKLTVGVSEQGAAITGTVRIGSDAEADFVAYGPTAFAPTLTQFVATVYGTLYLGVDVASAGIGVIGLEAGRVVVANADPDGVSEAVFFGEGPNGPAASRILDVTGNAGGYAGGLYDFDQAGDEIVAALATGPGTHAPVLSASGDVLTISQGGAGPDATETFTFDDTTVTLAEFDVTVTGNAIDILYAPCFATGTRIATRAGEVAVEDLRPGDEAVLADGTAARVAWIGHRRATGCDVVRVRAGTLGAARDLVVSDDHALFVDGCLVPAGLLVDGRAIVREPRATVTFWHVELDRHAILLADGVAAESYLDTGNRARFANCPLGYDPARALGDPCAELVLAGARLAAIRSRIRRFEPA